MAYDTRRLAALELTTGDIVVKASVVYSTIYTLINTGEGITLTSSFHFDNDKIIFLGKRCLRTHLESLISEKGAIIGATRVAVEAAFGGATSKLIRTNTEG